MRLRIRIEKYDAAGWTPVSSILTPFDVEPTSRADWLDGLEEGARVLARDIGHLAPSELNEAISEWYTEYPDRRPATDPSTTPNPDAPE